METKDEFIALRVSPFLKKSLEVLAEADRRSLSDYLRIVLEDHMSHKGKKNIPAQLWLDWEDLSSVGYPLGQRILLC